MIDHLVFIFEAHQIQDLFSISRNAPFIVLGPVGCYHIIAECNPFGKFRVLRKIADPDPVSLYDFPCVRLLFSRKYPKQRRFPGAVDPHDPRLVLFFNAEVNTGKKLPVRETLPDLLRRQ